MIPYFGDFAEDETLYIPFNTFSSNDPSASVTITNLAAADIKVHKDGSTTEIVTDGATIAIDFDAITGNHLITIDTSVHADYAVGSDYIVRIEGTTVDSGTINAWVGSFSIENRSRLISTAASGNLELMYDGNGYIDDTAPASRAQVGGLGGGSSSGVNIPVSADNTAGAIIGGITFVGSQTGTYANTETNPGTFHQISDTGNAIDLVYRLACGATREAVTINTQLYLNSNNDALNIQLWDHVGSDWETQISVTGKNGSAIDDYPIRPFSKHTGAIGSAEAGNVYIRFVCTAQSTPTLFIATCTGEAVTRESLLGYEGGHVYCDEVSGKSSGTTQGEDGVFANQSDDFDNVQTIADNLGSSSIVVRNGNNITLAAHLEGYTVHGNGGILQLGGFNIGGTILKEWGVVSGVAATSANPCFAEKVIFQTCSIPPGVFQTCGFGATFTMVSAGDYTFVDPYSDVAGAGSPVWTKTPGQAITAEWRSMRGGVTLSNIEAGDVFTIGGNELGTVTLNGANGTVEIRGIYKDYVDNRTGSPVLNLAGAIKASDVAAILVDTGTTLPNRFDTVDDAIVDAHADISLIQVILTGITSLAEWLGLIAGKQAGNTTARTEIRSTGAASGTFDETTDSIEAIRNATLTALQVNAEVDTALADYDGPTKAEMDTGLGLLATEAKQDIIDTNVDAILVDTGTTLPTQINTIINSVNIGLAIPSVYQMPSGAERFKITAVIYDTLGNLADPDTNTVTIAVYGTVVDGSKSANLYNALSAGAATTTMNRIAAGHYELWYEVDGGNDDLEQLTFLVSYAENGKSNMGVAQTNIVSETLVGKAGFALSTAGLAQFITVDTGETTAVAGSVAKIAQGAAGGNVTVGAMTAPALAQFATVDTTETTSVAGSVATLSQGSGGSIEVVLPLSGHTPERTRSTTITVFTGETLTIAVPVFDADGVAVDMSGLSLWFGVWNRDHILQFEDIPTGTVTGFTFTVPIIATPEAGWEWIVRTTPNTAGEGLVSGQFKIKAMPVQP